MTATWTKTTAWTPTANYDQPTSRNDACEHKETTHWHGTNACARLDNCPCGECVAARRRYDRWWKLHTGEFAVAPSLTVPAEPVRRHVRNLLDQGMGLKRIAEVSGVAHGGLWKLHYGSKKASGRKRRSRRVLRATAEALFATVADVADGAKVDGTEARAIFDELRARGWTNRAIAAGIDLGESNLFRGPTVQAGTLRRLRLLLDEPVPPRRSKTGTLWHPKTGHTWQHVPASTPGVPPPTSTPAAPIATPAVPTGTAPGRGVTSNRTLTCAVCNLPLADHSITRPCTVPR